MNVQLNNKHKKTVNKIITYKKTDARNIFRYFITA